MAGNPASALCTVRDQFLTGRNRSSLTKINADFFKWINEYHHTVHRGIAMSPLNKKLTDQGNGLVQCLLCLLYPQVPSSPWVTHGGSLSRGKYTLRLCFNAANNRAQMERSGICGPR